MDVIVWLALLAYTIYDRQTARTWWLPWAFAVLTILYGVWLFPRVARLMARRSLQRLRRAAGRVDPRRRRQAGAVTPPSPTCAGTPPCPAIDTGNATFIGDYAGIAANGGFAHPVWTTGGINNTIPGANDGILQTATLQLP